MPENKKSFAKAFFEDINDEQPKSKADTFEENLHKYDKEIDLNPQDDQLVQKKFKTEEGRKEAVRVAHDRAKNTYSAEQYNGHVAGLGLGHPRGDFGDGKDSRTGNDMASSHYENQLNPLNEEDHTMLHYEEGTKPYKRAYDAKKERVEKGAKTFEDNLHKYDKPKKKSFAKKFFEDID